ncbi:hypothetical protein P5V15_002682 [Pogonomyrmex californicus]
MIKGTQYVNICHLNILLVIRVLYGSPGNRNGDQPTHKGCDLPGPASDGCQCLPRVQDGVTYGGHGPDGDTPSGLVRPKCAEIFRRIRTIRMEGSVHVTETANKIRARERGRIILIAA